MQALVDPSNYAFSAYSIPVLLCGMLIATLGLVTLRRERASLVSVRFCLCTLLTALWLVAFAATYSTTDRSVAVMWIKIAHLGVAFIPATVFWFAAAVTDQLRACRWLIRAALAVAAVLWVIIVSTDWILSDIEHYYFGYYSIFSWKASWALLAYFGFCLAGTVHLYRVTYLTTQSAVRRARVKAMLVAIVFAHFGGIDFLPDFHVPIYPVGYVFIAGVIVALAWALARYRLVDITPALAAQQVINTMAEGLLIVDRDGIVRVANDAAASVWGLESSAVGSAAATLDSRWGQDGLMRLIDPASEHEAEVTYHAGDGSLRTVVLASSKLLDHQAVWVGTVFIIHDITERWRAELALRESEERFRSLVQNASDLITVIDPDTTIRYQSPAIKRVLGLDAEAAVGQKLSDVIHPDDRGRFLAAMSELM